MVGFRFAPTHPTLATLALKGQTQGIVRKQNYLSELSFFTRLIISFR